LDRRLFSPLVPASTTKEELRPQRRGNQKQQQQRARYVHGLARVV